MCQHLNLCHRNKCKQIAPPTYYSPRGGVVGGGSSFQRMLFGISIMTKNHSYPGGHFPGRKRQSVTKWQKIKTFRRRNLSYPPRSQTPPGGVPSPQISSQSRKVSQSPRGGGRVDLPLSTSMLRSRNGWFRYNQWSRY